MEIDLNKFSCLCTVVYNKPMCGVCGYVGNDDAQDVLYEGLGRLEYRGYDSAGIAVLNERGIVVQKAVGKLSVLQETYAHAPVHGTVGIGHTRWATHGVVSQANAHPHVSYDGSCALVHNGIIENFAQLKQKLVEDGIHFQSETDSEVIAHLFAKNYNGILSESVLATLEYLEGTYGLLLVHEKHPDTIVGVCHGSPMVIANARSARLLASDPSALRRFSDTVVYMEHGEIAQVSKDEVSIYNRKAVSVQKTSHKITWDLSAIERGAYTTFMEKEIHEHPTALRNALAGRIDIDEANAVLGGMNISLEQLRSYEAVELLAMGTSYHAAEVGAMLIERLARIPARATLASEFVSCNPLMRETTLYLVLSQSGETYDTIIAMRELKKHGLPVRGICNVVGSTIARETDGGSFMHSGNEISVASTKAFSGQLGVLYALALIIARSRDMSFEEGKAFLDALHAIPEKMEAILLQKERVKTLAHQYAHVPHLLYLGRGISMPIARESALKLKEVSYINANACSASEMKHGTIALIDEHFPSVFLMADDRFSVKMKSNIAEVKARGGSAVLIAPETLQDSHELVDDALFIPQTHELFYPFLFAVATHLFALYVAQARKVNVDMPRNLAKSVTVE